MRKLNKIINMTVAIFLIGSVFYCSYMVYAQETCLRVPLGISNNRVEEIINEADLEDLFLKKYVGEIFFPDLVRERFSGYLEADKPVNIIDLGAGSEASFCFNLREVLISEGIDAKIYGVDPYLHTETGVVEKAEKKGIILKNWNYEGLLNDPEEKGKYHIITINGAPEIFYEYREFLKNMDYLLSEDGVVIIRQSQDPPGFFARQSIDLYLESFAKKKWAIRYLDEIKGLPEGNYPLYCPVLMCRSPKESIIDLKSALGFEYPLIPGTQNFLLNNLQSTNSVRPSL